MEADMTKFFPKAEVLQPLIESLAFVVEYKDEIWGKAPLKVRGFQFAFKDDPDVVYLSRNLTSRWVDENELVTPDGETLQFDPSALWNDFLRANPDKSQEEADRYAHEKELEKDRAEAVASLLWYNQGW